MTRSANDQSRPPPDHQQELVKLITSLAYRHSAWQVFADFAEMAAISVSNAVDSAQRNVREERYVQIIKRYEPDELAKFPQMLAEVTLALETEPSDVLGRSFHDLELHNKWAGQYFSPYPLCRMIAKMTLGDEESLRAKIAERGFVKAAEPACGSGAMVIALAHGLKDLDVSYQQHLHVTAVDVDAKCVHMAYLQFSILHIPAIVVQGNSLSLEEYGRWYTPAHIMNGWNWRLRREADGSHEVHGVPDERHPERPQAKDESPPQAGQLTLF